MASNIFNFSEKSFLTVNNTNFESIVLATYQYQIEHNPVYRQFLQYLNVDLHTNLNSIDQIRYLPIELYKTNKVTSSSFNPQAVFESSGTTGQQPSRHYIKDLSVYESSFNKTFELAFGNPADYCFLCLLPSYLERENSSLVYMAQKFVSQSKYPESGFYLDDLESLSIQLQQLNDRKTPTILLGVSFALLDLAEQFPQPLHRTTIMETGGMKGKREELTRSQLHHTLKEAFHVDHVYSEYGMTELLSQAYTNGKEWFTPPPWMQIIIRNPYDPFEILPPGQKGAINVIDLANVHSCSFIATSDLGQKDEQGRFKVLGRMDSSEIRGCNLMLEV